MSGSPVPAAETPRSSGDPEASPASHPHAAQAPAGEAQHYRLLAENASDVVFSGAPDGVLDWISPSVQRVLGQPPQAVVGRSLVDLVHPADHGVLAAGEERLLQGEPAAFRVRMSVANGGVSWMQVSVTPVRDAYGRIVRHVGSWRDVSSEIAAQEALEQRELELAEAQRLADVGSWRMDLTTGEYSWSDAMFRIAGLPVARGPVSASTRTAGVSEETQRRLRDLLLNSAGTGAAWELEYQLTQPGGSVRTVIARGEPVRGGEGQTTGFRGTVADITSALAEREARARRVAHRADYLARVEHILRTHLSVVEGWADMLADREQAMDEEERRRAIDAISRNATALVGRVNALMTESAQAMRAESLVVGPIDVAQVAAEVVSDYEGLSADLRFSVLPGNGVVVLGEAEALDTVLRHLIENAIRHCHHLVEVLSHRTGDGLVEVVVRDDGAGLPEGLRPFEAFSRSDLGSGHGLGLHVVRTLVEALGGQVTAANRSDGPGACFTVSLPAPTSAL